MTEATEETKRGGVPVWAQILIWVLLLGLLGLIAASMITSKEGPIRPGDEVRDFTMPLFDGYTYNGASEITLSDLRGKVVVINFWASWCKPCEQEAAEIEEAWRYFEPTGDVIFLGADYVDTEPEARAYLKKFDITFPNGPDMGTRISQMFRISGVPETYFIDQNGVLRYVQIGPFTSTAQIIQQINELLQTP